MDIALGFEKCIARAVCFHHSMDIALNLEKTIPSTLFRRPSESLDQKLDFMLSGANFMYIYQALMIIRVIESQRGSELA